MSIITQKYNINNKTIFGFWLYIMSDCVLFASLFAMYAVLKTTITDLSSYQNIFVLPFVFIETCCLLLSSLTYGAVTIYSKKLCIKKIIFWLHITMILGLCFSSMEIYEFYHLIQSGNNPCKNAFFSAFFILVGTHGLHVIAGLIWMIVMTIHLICTGITDKNQTRLQCLGLFWHFLDIIWICVFTEVYLMGGVCS